MQSITFMFVLNNKIYGITAAGGNDAGVIFELDLSYGTFTRKFEMGTLLNGPYVSGHAFSFFNGRFYGVVKNITSSDEAVFFEWAPALNTLLLTQD